MRNTAVFLSATEVNGNTETTVAPDRLNRLSETTKLPVATPAQLAAAGFYLYWRNGKLTLKDQYNKRPVDVCIDFCTGKNRHRLQFGSGYGQPLARAVNAKPDTPQTICDATGGLGQDAFVIASLGCHVVLCERSKVVFALLQDGIRRALSDPDIAPVAQLMEVYQLDSQQLADQWPHAQKPHTVYLDPMYPHTTKSAAAKKGMQTLQHLLPNENLNGQSVVDNEVEERNLLNAALDTATRRVVIKRPAKAAPLAGSTPVGCIKSPNTRYDIYKPHN